ncbi:MAG TPA: CHASE domain-containing protein [Porticoccaceae bacterium]|nr:CHASE domain-containing protein [Porticoccaceae bacterium]
MMQTLRFSRFSLLPWALLLAGLLATSALALRGYTGVREEARARFTFVADQVALKIEERLHLYRLTLNGAAGLFAHSGEVSRGEWHAYVDKLRIDANIPGVQGIGFARLIRPEDLAAHVAAVRAEGFADYRVWPEGERDIYSAIVYLEPFRDRNLRAFGYDMFSEPVRRTAMEAARDQDRAAITGKVVLKQEAADQDVQAGFLMYVPVYRAGLPIETLAQRRDALLGWAYSPYRMNDLMAGILGSGERQSLDSQHVSLRIHDGVEHGPDNLLYQSDPGEAGPGDPLFHQSRQIDFNGRPWLLTFDRDPGAPGLDYGPVWVTLAGGLASTLLLVALVLSLLRTERRAERRAEVLTLDLRERQQALEESEFRWKFALEGAGEGLWDWNIPAATVFFSPRWKAMLGHAEDEIGNGLDEWQSRVHPDDLDATLAQVRDYLEGRAPRYHCEHRMRRKGGDYIWILDRGMVVSRDAGGAPLRMIGSHADISATKALEQSLRDSQAELLEAQRIGRIGSWTLDLASDRVSWTAELYRMFGIDPAGPAPDYHRQAALFTPPSWAALSEAVATAARDGTPYSLELETVEGDSPLGWLLARGEAIRGADGAVTGLRGIAMDITDSKRARTRIERLSQLYSALSACNSAIVHCRDENDLFTRICEVVVREGGMRMAWIGQLDDATGRILPTHSFGEGTDYLDGIEVSARGDDPRGRGPTGTATRDNRPVWLDDFAASASTAPWHERAARYRWGSSAAIPIRRAGRPVGALTFYAEASHWFDDEIRRLLEEMAGDISYALDKFAAEASARAYQAGLVEAEQRFNSLIEQSIAGAYIIQDGHFAYVNPRFKAIFGYDPAEDFVGRDPRDLICPEDRAASEERMRALLAREVSATEGMFAALRKDGTRVRVSTNSSLASYQQRPAVIGLVQDIADRKVAEDHIRRYADELEKLLMQTVGLVTNLVEMRDPYTAGHEKRVAEIAEAIGVELGLDPWRLEGLRVGGYLHDVGKIVVPAEILTKPGRLSAVEYAIIQAHPVAGFDILKDVSFPWPVAQIAHQHHERIDGSGYPQGLKGEEILLEARIVTVADVIESMATDRPYRPALGVELALEEIARGAGSAYDPAVVEACLRLFRDKGYVIQREGSGDGKA